MKKQTAKMLGACITGAIISFVGFVMLTEFFPSKSNYFNDKEETYFISRDICFHRDYGENSGYIFNCDGKTLKNVYWIAKPLGNDSLACYSDGKKRGYFNLFTGKAVIEPKYAHAWIFSDGLAAVEEDGWVKFIDQTGNVVIDNKIPYIPGREGHVFHNGHCVVHDRSGSRVGLIDTKGNWVLQPEFFRIEPKDSLWIVSNGKQNAVLSSDFKTIIPFTDASFQISDNKIEATMPDHTIHTYNRNGEITEDFYISDISLLIYDTYESQEMEFKQGVAHCRCYEAQFGWYGLINPQGHIVTPPSYTNIKAIGPDLYFCKVDDGKGIILNGKGQRVK